MVEVLLNWMIIFLTSYALGYLVLLIFSKLLGIRNIVHLISSGKVVCVFTGLAFINAYAQYFSLFMPVSMWSNLIIIIICFGIYCYLIKNGEINLGSYVNHHEFKKHILTKRNTVFIVLVMLMAYGTSRGYIHYDTNLYHAQAIRWIEEYGLVPGLANLQSRFGYNSAEFSLNALFSYKWLLGRSLHTSAGYFALLSSLIMVDITHIWSKWKDYKKLNFWLSDFIRVGLLYYLCTIFGEMVSPASDYYAQLLIFDIVIVILDVIELEKDRDISKLEEMGIISILCLIMVYAVTIKLSIGLLIILAVIPAVYLVNNKKNKSIFFLIAGGLFISIPYLIRNHFISGWILYPSTILSFGHPKWQLPKGEAQYDAKEIGMWGRGIKEAKDWSSVSGLNWVKDWFNQQIAIDKFLLICCAISLFFILLLLTGSIIKGKIPDLHLYIMLVLGLGTIFWFISAPLVRYGYAYLIILPLFCVGYFICNISIKVHMDRGKMESIVLMLSLLAIVLLKTKGLITGIYQRIGYDYYLRQQDYIDGEAHTYEIDGITVYVADDAGQIGYYKFPSSVEEKDNIKLIGEDLSGGFCRK